MRVVRLYRYPVKSLSPERCDALEIADDGRVVGDRVFAFRFASVNPVDPDEWLPKTNYASLQHIPGLATLRSSYATDSGVLMISAPDGGFSVSGDPKDPAVRADFSAAMSDWYASTATSSKNHRRIGGFNLVGEGVDSKLSFHDTKQGNTTLHSQSSVDALAHALGRQHIDESRFRSNIVIDGCDAWEEFTWRGVKLQIGDVTFAPIKPVTRCLATHVDPDAGVRDADVMGTLTKVIGQDVPQFAISLRALNRGGQIRVGDAVSVVG